MLRPQLINRRGQSNLLAAVNDDVEFVFFQLDGLDSLFVVYRSSSDFSTGLDNASKRRMV